ncbi:MAG: protein-tyrosine-phosphatase [Bacteroidetes bacterium]|nr:protein-tyrosine-phosphatase [Bacteroidota bacterium]
MLKKVESFLQDRLGEFALIPDERKAQLQKIADYISARTHAAKKTALVYICIHNSRRSHFGQIAAALAAHYYGIKLDAYSGGTVATAFNQNAVNALRGIGFKIETADISENPHYTVFFDDAHPVHSFSKVYDDPVNPQTDFAAIMTCSEAEENCPFIPNAGFKIGTTYDDPKAADGTGKEADVYTQRFAQILRETLYAFSLVKPNL